jgi:hypothetical protein
VAIVLLAAGALALYIPWQVHCVYAVGHPVLTVYQFPSKNLKGVKNWQRTWSRTQYDHEVLFFSSNPSRFDRVPDWAFQGPEERCRLRQLCEGYAAGTTSRREVNESFQAAADRRVREAPISYYFMLPVMRCVTAWTNMIDLWPAQRTYVGRLGWDTFSQDVAQVGPKRALLRQGKAIYSTAVAGSFIIYAAGFALLAVAALRSRHPIAMAIVLGAAAFTFAGAVMGVHQLRRTLPFYPALFFLLYYVGGARRQAKTPGELPS